MFTATLIADPARAGLDRATVELLRNAWGGGEARWLNPGTATEFPLAAMPANRWEAWQSLQSLGFDLVLQPTANRRKRLLVADMDSTMIHQECIDELAAEAGVGTHVAAITARAMNGELDSRQPQPERVGLLKGLAEGVIAKVLAERITMMPGGAVACRHDEGERRHIPPSSPAASLPSQVPSPRPWGSTNTAPTPFRRRTAS